MQVDSTNLTFLQKHHPRKPIIQVPEVDTAHSAFVIQFSIDINSLIHPDFHFPHLLARLRAILPFFQRGLELVAPRTPIAVPVAVVVTEQVIPSGPLASPDLERLVDGGEEVFGEVGSEGAYAGEIGGGVFRVQAAEEVTGRD